MTYKGNLNLKRTNVNQDWTAEQIKEFRKCAKNPKYFIKKYVKIIDVDKGWVNFELRPFQHRLIDSVVDNRFTICKVGRQQGKALDLETPIYTTDGWKKFGELVSGDEVYGTNGQPTKVMFVTETMYDHDCYNVELDEGTVIKADGDHLWSFYVFEGKGKDHILHTKTTKELVSILEKTKKGGKGVGIKINEPLSFTERQQDIPPYLLGLWLGDGTSRTGQITCHKDDYQHYKKKINDLGFEVGELKLKKENSGIFNVVGLRNLLNKNKLLRNVKDTRSNKHIPENYIYSSIEQRYELLKGLMDSDGYAAKTDGQVQFYQKNKQIIEEVTIILRTLGIKSRITSKIINDEIYHTINFRPSKEVFSLERKIENQKIALNKPLRRQEKHYYFKSIEKIDSLPVKCIGVEAEDSMFLVGKTFIPTHNSIAIVALLLWYILFHEDCSIALLAQRGEQAQELLLRLQQAYEAIPAWMQQGIREWNKRSIILENGSKIVASSTSSGAIRGKTQNIIYLDEFAHIPQHIQEEFFASVFPTISSGESTKMIITSTPLGLNLFYKIWVESEQGRNSYVRVDGHWSEVPGRDEKWKKETIRNTSERQFKQEFEAEFLGSSDTLIEGEVLRRLVLFEPIKQSQHLKVYELPNKENIYAIMVDVAEGNNNDCSAFIVVNMSKLPYEVAAVYKNNKISPLIYPHVIEEVAKRYNDAYVLIETNNVGQQVADILYRDLEYEYVIMTAAQGASGLKISSGFGTGSKIGLRTTKQTKRVGCVNLKTLVESDKLILKDYDIIYELSRFSLHGDSYKAESGYDDLAMALVLLGWFQQQPFVKELSNTDARKTLYSLNQKGIEEDIIPAGEYVNPAQDQFQPVKDIVNDYFDKWFFEDPEDIKWLQ